MTATTDALDNFWRAYVDTIRERLFCPPDEFGERDSRLCLESLQEIDRLMRKGRAAVEQNDAAFVAATCKQVDDVIALAFKHKLERHHLVTAVVKFRDNTYRRMGCACDQTADQCRVSTSTAEQVEEWIKAAFFAADDRRADEVERLLNLVRDKVETELEASVV